MSHDSPPGHDQPPPLVLASTSRYRRALLERLGVPFLAVAPDADETPLPGESPRALVARLSRDKAASVAAHHPGALIIGSDQVAVLDGRVVGKPGSHAAAAEQLRRAAGREVAFLTGLCLLRAADGHREEAVEPFTVVFRPLDEATIQRYLERDRPYDCAGSFKSEGLGITLFQRMVGDDPTALMGLPLIRLTTLLGRLGVWVP